MKRFYYEGNYLKICREKLKMTQKQVSESLDVHIQFVSNWERGLCQPPMHAYKKLMEILKIKKNILKHIMLYDADLAINNLEIFKG